MRRSVETATSGSAAKSSFKRCDRFSQVGIFFPALWTEPDFVGVLPRGTPVAQCIPLRREEPKLAFLTLSGDDAAAQVALTREILERPGVYKSRFRAKRKR